MKKRILILILTILLIVLAATGCGANQYTPQSREDTAAEAPDYAPLPYEKDEQYIEEEFGGYDSGSYDIQYAQENSLDLAAVTVLPAGANDKIIYYFNASVETIRFEETMEAVDALIEKYNGFIESSSVTGSNYNASYDTNRQYRTANFIIRIPKEAYKLMTEEIPTLGNMVYGNTQAQNITSQFMDTESRLKTYRVEEERLLSMLEKADTVADMITIETRLSEVRYNIESLTTTLNNWTSLIDYSTVNLSITEVKELTPEVTIPRTLGEEITDALNKTFTGLKDILRSSLIVLIAALPILVIACVILVVLLVIFKARSKRRKARRAVMNPNPVPGGYQNFDPNQGNH
jgi:flagellar basal body-associated protein FliL